MKPASLVIITLLYALFLGCESNTENYDSALSGTWVEQTERLDTIYFTTFGSAMVLHLRRACEFYNGSMIPQNGSGYYSYELAVGDTISLCYSFSSSCLSSLPCSFSKYYFKRVREDIIEISNFYNLEKKPEEIFTFQRAR